MKVAYVLTWPRGAWTGVFKKVADQVGAWSDLGVEAGVFVATSLEAEADWRSLPLVKGIETFTSAIESFSVQPTIIRRAAEWSPDIAYLRSTPRQAYARRHLRSLPHVIEIQSNDLEEARGLSRQRLLLTQVTRNSCLGGARGLVFVSRELSTLPSYAQFTDRRTVIGNGIELGRLQTMPAPATNLAPRLAFMGLPDSPWHGLDDVYELARVRPEWSFDLIGPTQTESTPRLPNLHFHGELRSDEYLPILAKADAAISTLAWYRNSMNEASPLKSREYLALGLPVIGAYEDTDIPPNDPVYLQLPNRPGAIIDEVDRVEQFIRGWQGKRVRHDQIAYLDTAVKEAARIDFLRTCAHKSST